MAVLCQLGILTSRHDTNHSFSDRLCVADGYLLLSRVRWWHLIGATTAICGVTQTVDTDCIWWQMAVFSYPVFYLPTCLLSLEDDPPAVSRVLYSTKEDGAHRPGGGDCEEGDKGTARVWRPTGRFVLRATDHVGPTLFS